MSDFERFKEELPCKENFYSSLTDRKITDKEYEYLWNKFAMKTIKDYHDLHLKCDVLLLADVFKKFRNKSLKNYELCPNHYLSAPGLIQDAMLKITKTALELILDPDIYIFFVKGTRCGNSYISNRYSKASNKYLKSCDPKQESKTYLDANNLYSYSMSNFFPTSGFK